MNVELLARPELDLVAFRRQHDQGPRTRAGARADRSALRSVGDPAGDRSKDCTRSDLFNVPMRRGR